MSALLDAVSAFVADISPKVKSGTAWGSIATLAVAFLGTVTPSMLTWSGPFEPLIIAAIPLVIAQIAAWSKTDPLRAAGKAAEAAATASTPPAPPAA
ncbi:hypothetical protein SCMU_13690 [Sinomonas cyclohexanicum]|uniref:Holin n=1 Tax=Sinomonas cyclohexanicum TaxID=322009 RepID=A0ABM7PTF4_SINCY|nr:hypothetical protein [Corynebacterium cyclohexanicum]BCT75527.1 hypothetical protein SCMU_13690 [Corynebacterium cyclohexanicum]